MEAQAIAVEKTFAAAEEKFTGLVARLSAEESRRMTHSELESLIAAEGREIHRRLLQGHLELRASDEQVQASVRGADDVERTHRRGRARGLLTVFGLVTVMRMTYGARRHGSLSPLDASLNLPEELHSHGLRRLAAIEAARLVRRDRGGHRAQHRHPAGKAIGGGTGRAGSAGLRRVL